MKTTTVAHRGIDRIAARQLWNEWTDLWNGNFELAQVVVGSRFELTPTSALKVNPATVHDPATVAEWIGSVRNSFRSIEYTTVDKPYFDPVAQTVACAWEGKGIYAGKTGSPEDRAGESFHIVGTDILRLQDGKIRGYRTFSCPAV